MEEIGLVTPPKGYFTYFGIIVIGPVPVMQPKKILMV